MSRSGGNTNLVVSVGETRISRRAVIPAFLLICPSRFRKQVLAQRRFVLSVNTSILSLYEVDNCKMRKVVSFCARQEMGLLP